MKIGDYPKCYPHSFLVILLAWFGNSEALNLFWKRETEHVLRANTELDAEFQRWQQGQGMLGKPDYQLSVRQLYRREIMSKRWLIASYRCHHWASHHLPETTT